MTSAKGHLRRFGQEIEGCLTSAPDQERYLCRECPYQLERFFNRIKQCRRVATRYDKAGRQLHCFRSARVNQAMAASL